MKIDIIEINPNDTVLCVIPIGNIPPYEVDTYVSKILPTFKEAFECKVVLIPSRNVDEIDFTVIRKG